jgi:asparagine synthetase B (glutamine-hydrolysing)
MIVYPKDWDKDYTIKRVDPMIYVDGFRDFLNIILEEMNVIHLAYSGGIDSTIMLAELTEYYGKGVVHTYTISSRDDHPDVLFARKGSKFYDSIHHEFIVEPESLKDDDLYGDHIVRQFFNEISKYTFEIICCDGIDEYMCGYYDHVENPAQMYPYFLSKLNQDHLQPLNRNSKGISVCLPYLESHFVGLMSSIDLEYKISHRERKKLVTLWAKVLKIPKEFIYRNKYGFVDAFMEEDK